MGESNNMVAALTAAVGCVIADFYQHLQWWLALGAMLVLVDLRFGILAAKARGEVIRTSRAWRRTLNKMVDYLCMVTLAELLSRTFGVSLGAPVISMGMLFIIYGIELNSTMNNYLEYKGLKKKKFDIWKLIGRKNPIEDENTD